MGTVLINSLAILLSVAGDSVPQSVGSQLSAALVVGLLLAFGLQFLLANLGVAIGATAFSFRFFSSDRASNSTDITEAEASEPSSKRIGISTWVGLGMLLTTDLVLFVSCFLSVRFSQIEDLTSGAIVGAVIWAAYFFILLWFSTTAATSLFSTLLGFTATGISGLVTLVRHAFRSDRESAAELDPKSLAVLNQIKESLDLGSLQKTLETYLEALPPPQLDSAQIRAELAAVLQEPELQPVAINCLTDRVQLREAIQQRLHLSSAMATQVVDELESVLQEVAAGQSAKTEDPTDSKPDPSSTAAQTSSDSQEFDSRESDSQEVDSSPLSSSPQQTDPSWKTRLWHLIQSASPEQLTQQLDREFLQQNLETWLKQEGAQLAAAVDWQAMAAQIDWQQLMHLAWQRVDLSDFDLETIWHRIQKFATDPNTAEQNSESEPFNVVQLDVANYLLNLEQKRLLSLDSGEFSDVLYDPEADPQFLRSQLEQLTTSVFVTCLNQRNDLTEQQVQTVVNQLTDVTQQVLSRVEAALQNLPNPAEQATPSQAATMADLTTEAAELQQQLESYLRYTNLKYLVPERIGTKLKSLPSLSPLSVTPAVLAIDRAALETVLQQRKGLSRKRRCQILKQIEQVGEGKIRYGDRPQSDSSSETAAASAHSPHSVGQRVTPRRWILRQLAVRAQTLEGAVAKISDNQPSHATDTDPAASEVALDRLLAQLSNSLRPVTELPEAVEQLKHNLLDQFTNLKFDRSIGQTWQSVIEQISIPRSVSLEQGQEILRTWQEQLQAVGEEMVAGLELPQQLSATTEAYLRGQLQQMKQQLLQQVDSLQQEVQGQLTYWANQAQQRLEATRRAAAIAIWWLFAIAFTAVLSAATAGALATRIS